LVSFFVAAGWISAWWFSKKFNEVHDAIDNKVEKLEKTILTKLEYHERHDDERFSSVDKAVWEIKVRNAAIDARKL